MRWTYGRESNNVEDARGGGGIGGPAMIGGGGIGIAVLALVAMFFGVDPRVVLNGVGGGGQDAGYQQPAQPAQDTGPQGEQVKFVRLVLGSTEDVWGDLFRQMNARYDPPKLVLFSGVVQSGCGTAPVGDRAVLLPGRSEGLPRPVVLQRAVRSASARPATSRRPTSSPTRSATTSRTLLGITAQVERAQRQAGQEQANQLSVRLELQADCLAGVWAQPRQPEAEAARARRHRGGHQAAAAVGDDRLQKQARGYVVPDSFTHGSSAQRVRWFRRGIESGDIGQCNTFGAASSEHCAPS